MKQLLTFALLIFSSQLYSNAISVSNMVVTPSSQTISFDLQWENSWRIDSMSSPFNWDAAWVFVKFAECDSTSSITDLNWLHGKLNTNIASQNFGNLEPVLNDGSIGMADSLGVMLRRSVNGIFNNAPASSIDLLVMNMDPTKTYHVRVVAIEMVYVTQGAFDIGGLSNSNSFDSIRITSENSLTVTSLATGGNSSIDLAAAFPKGFNPFHCMKYEISEGQYATFLNTITSTQALPRFPNTTAYRNVLVNTGTGLFESYTSDRPDRAMNYMSWDDFLAYLDWSALSPMTELQFEKACRGLDNAVLDEFAWGTTTILNGQQFTGAENGTEFFVNSNANTTYNNILYTGGDGGRGPVRVGIHALPSNNTREQSGATYYGILDMSGNIYEFCVNVSTFTESGTGVVNFSGTLGDGYLDPTGMWDVPNWPLANMGSAERGGSFFSSNAYSRLSSRYYFLVNGNRYQDSGGRGIR